MCQRQFGLWLRKMLDKKYQDAEGLLWASTTLCFLCFYSILCVSIVGYSWRYSATKLFWTNQIITILIFLSSTSIAYLWGKKKKLLTQKKLI